ncbi:MAG: hypothetical protein JOZ74_16550 [Bradyrhizobium sp.]|nr:hypothetical protein [Bradyrhizobium sp.]
MRSFTKRCGAYLALIALALQLALSFAHIHARDLSATGTALAKPRAADSWHRPAGVEASNQSPSKLVDDEDFCPVCFSGLLWSTCFVPDAPRPPAVLGFQRIDRRFINTIGFAATPRAPFQPRAPPFA